MATVDDLRRAALALPGAHEDLHMGSPAFRVGTRKFALFWMPENRTIMKLPKDLQMILFEARPETFEPVQVGTSHWSYVELDYLDEDELADFVRRAWRTVAPRSLGKLVAGPDPESVAS